MTDPQLDQNEINADPTVELNPSDSDFQLGELLETDPRELIIGPNIRGSVVLDQGFVRSVRERGVREPIHVRRRADDGALVVRKGKRRTLAAVEAGLDRVRVLIDPDTDPGEYDRRGQIERIVDQLEENLHRAGNPRRRRCQPTSSSSTWA
ncbi:ParB N-terminal domain-containing protein [Pseudonocardia alaniniphila]|uniref:ParB N-terminal domain-containing protein n=1 Tax=Pseudonocardia alaniniphila TaxID=75291 RepID=A0ABS9TRW6_9PSEU|nr:ParB N-terminal domain-containing protein [Pseudonocardia alaniniphila]MCH6171303.1 ParB N-terminal domain-containing protein [Pseudonocardia alaniniphila]